MPRTHKSFPRLYVEPDLAAGDDARRSAREQTNYLVTVLRMKEGDAVVLFNGRDGAWLAKITARRQEERDARTQSSRSRTRPRRPTSGSALLRSRSAGSTISCRRRPRWAPGPSSRCITKFTQARTKPDKLAANVARSGRAMRGADAARRRAGDRPRRPARRLAARRRGSAACSSPTRPRPPSSPVDQLGWLEGLPVGILIGPEGGFSDDERDLLLAQDFVVPISLGPRILRADTAAVAALALVQAIIGDWR